MAVNTKLVKPGEYGKLELNFAAFRRNGAIEAQCKIADGIDYIENGMLLAVDRKAHTVGYPTGTGDVIALNYTTEHMYDERANALKNFKLEKNTFLPRLGYIGVADKFTTNTVCYDSAEITDIAAALKAGKVYGKPCTTEGYKGYIELTKTAEGAVVEAIEYTTMPDGQPAVKFVGI
jgi:hypothetical protein